MPLNDIIQGQFLYGYIHYFNQSFSFFLKEMKHTAAPVTASAAIGSAWKSSPVLGESVLPAGAELDDFFVLVEDDDFDDDDAFAVVVEAEAFWRENVSTLPSLHVIEKLSALAILKVPVRVVPFDKLNFTVLPKTS